MSKIAGIFPIGDSGLMYGVAEWYPDPEELEAELLKLADDTEDWTEPLVQAREAFIYSTANYFDEEKDPEGNKWTPLSPEYVGKPGNIPGDSRKTDSEFPTAILKRTGALEQAALAQESWLISERSIMFTSEKLPFYGPIHQAGTMADDQQVLHHKIRTGVGLTSEEAVRLRSLGMGIGNNLPQRMFVGANEGTIDEIEYIFVQWLNKLVDEDIGSGTIRDPIPGDVVFSTKGVQGILTNIPARGGGFMVRGAGGRFAGVFR